MSQSRRGSAPFSRVRSLLIPGIALLALALVLAGCTQPVIPSPVPPEATTPPGATVPPAAPPQVTPARTAAPGGSQYAVYENSRYGFQLSYPSTWTLQENSGGSAVVFQAPSEGKDDLYRENMKVIVEDLSSNPMSLEQYKDAQIAKKQGLNNFNKIMDGPYRVTTFNGWKLAYTANTGMLMEWVEVYTIKGTTAYSLIFTAKEDRYSNYVTEMDTMIKTFEFTS